MRLIIFSIISIFCFSLPAFAEEIQFQLDKEVVHLKTDGKKWKIASQQDAGNKGIVEYIANGEEVGNWSELVTINYFKEMQGGDLAKRLVDFTKKGIENQCAEVKWEDILIAPENALYQWSAQKCGAAPDQSEVARAFLGKDAFYVLHYANKKVPMPADIFQNWKKNLEEASAEFRG